MANLKDTCVTGNITATCDIAGQRLNIGSGHTLSGNCTTIAGGLNNTACNSYATVGGGSGNSSCNIYSTVSGGRCNVARSTYSTVGGGNMNVASGSLSTVGGGCCNTATNTNSTVGGGTSNTAGSACSTVGGGACNTTSGGSLSFIGGGFCNTVTSLYSTIAGGTSNTVNGSCSGILGGTSNHICGYTNSFIIGSNLCATAACTTFVNNISATGDGTFNTSDERLKRVDSDISCALTKLDKLQGFYYYYNDLAKEKGFTDERRRVGLSAQKVQEVLPEAVAPAPFDSEKEGYLTLRYERLVPLLVEAIKELKEEIDIIKNGR